MEVSGQLHALTTLPSGIESPVPIGQEALILTPMKSYGKIKATKFLKLVEKCI
jgi:hypothetical protein